MKTFFGRSGSRYFVWVSLAALLYGGPANSDRDVKHSNVKAALAHSDFALSGQDEKIALAETDIRLVLPDPSVRTAPADSITEVAFGEQDVELSSLSTSDECLVTEDCI